MNGDWYPNRIDGLLARGPNKEEIKMTLGNESGNSLLVVKKEEFYRLFAKDKEGNYVWNQK